MDALDLAADWPIEKTTRDILPCYRLHWETVDALWITASTEWEADPAPRRLDFGETLVFPVVAPARDLDRLAVKFAFDGRAPLGHLSAALTDPAGRLLRWERLNGQALADRDFATVLDLAGLVFEPGRSYAVSLRWFSETGEALAVFAGAGGRARPHRERLHGDEVSEPVVESVIRGLSPRQVIGWDEAGASWAAAQELSPEELAEVGPQALGAGIAFDFVFVRPAVRWQTLKLRFKIADRRVPGFMVVTLFDASGAIARQRRSPLSAIDAAGFATVLDADWLGEDAPACGVRIHCFGDGDAGVAIYAGPDRRSVPYGAPHRERRADESVAEPIVDYRITRLVPRYTLSWSDENAHWSRTSRPSDAGAAGFVPHGLEACCALAFEILSPATSWGSLAIQFATYGRRARAHLGFRLFGPAGDLLREARLDTSGFEDNAFATVSSFDGLAFAVGENYRVELDWFGEEGNEVAVYAGEGDAVVDGRPRLEKLREGVAYQPTIESRTEGLLPAYRLEWEADGAVWFVSPTVSGAEPASSVAHPFQDREALTFDIVATARTLSRLSVRFATYGRRPRSYLAAKLMTLSGETLRSHTWETTDLADNAFAPVLDLRGLAFEPGRKYRVILHWFGSAREQVAVWAAPLPGGTYELQRRLSHLSARRIFAPVTWAKTGRAGTAWLIATAADLERFGPQAEAVRSAFPDLAFTVVGFEEASRHLAEIRLSDVAIFVDMQQVRAADGLIFDDLCMDLHRNRVCTIFFDSRGTDRPAAGMTFVDPAAGTRAAHRSQARRCHYRVFAGGPGLAVEAATPRLQAEAGTTVEALDRDRLGRMIDAVWATSRPRVAVVSVLHRKATIIETFLDYVAAQSYGGDITTILVDDTSPEDDAERALAFGRRLEAEGVHNRKVVVVANPTNLGNCGSRLRGLAEVEADIAVVIDCDCLINRDFVAAHVFEHWWDDVDAVIGPLNIESHDRDPRAVVAALESDPALVVKESELQDPVLPEGFVNCVTRNFSIKRRRIHEEPLFDTDFSYSAKPGSGFGWEDVEMGYRLYAKGAVIRFTEDAFAVHCSHASSMPDERKVLGSTHNFAKLFRKHPDLSLVARRWSTDIYDRIVRWQDSLDLPSGPDRQDLDVLFAEPRRELAGLLSGLRGEGRRLRILTYRWHVPHQYELYKLPHDFTLVTGLGHSDADQWAFDQRPLRPNATMVPISQIDERDYDLVLLHFDENVLGSHVCNGIIPASWGEPFKRLMAVKSLPKIAICHGTVPFVGQYGLNPERKYVFEPHEEERAALVAALAEAGVRVVCNSHQAQAEWGFADSRVIWHGLDPQEFPTGTPARDVLALKADLHRPHYRGAWEHEEVVRNLDPGIAVETAAHGGTTIESRFRNPYAVRNFRSYVDRIRSFKFYLNTTLRSPMPRSRSEAMITGVVPVCLGNHDVDRFIENGVNGFYADRPEDLATFINDTIRRPDLLRDMSRQARTTAMRVFNNDRYLAEWTDLLLDTIARH